MGLLFSVYKYYRRMKEIDGDECNGSIEEGCILKIYLRSEDHKQTGIKFMNDNRALCVKANDSIVEDELIEEFGYSNQKLVLHPQGIAGE